MDIDPKLLPNLLFQAVRALQFYADVNSYGSPSRGLVAEMAALPAPIDADMGDLAKRALSDIEDTHLSSEKPTSNWIETIRFHYEGDDDEKVRVLDEIAVDGVRFYGEKYFVSLGAGPEMSMKEVVEMMAQASMNQKKPEVTINETDPAE